MTPVQSNNLYTPDQYLQEFTNLLEFDRVNTIEDLRYILDYNGYSDVWDRPLDEVDELMESGTPVVLVYDGRQVRWFEIANEVEPEYLGGISEFNQR